MLHICTIWQNNFLIVRLIFYFYVLFLFCILNKLFILFSFVYSFLSFSSHYFISLWTKRVSPIFLFWTDHNWYPWPSIDFKGKCLFVLSFIIIAVIAFVCVCLLSQKKYLYFWFGEKFLFIYHQQGTGFLQLFYTHLLTCLDGHKIPFLCSVSLTQNLERYGNMFNPNHRIYMYIFN